MVLIAVDEALATLERSPLSRKRAMLLALLIDRAIDEVPAGDPLARCRHLVRGALGEVLRLAALHEQGPRLVLDTVPVEDPESLSEADYMVSVYCGGMAPRVRFAWPDGRREDALPLLRSAAAALRAVLAESR
ncbi:hypothetical protein [Leucobacter massiliensis]|uniref:hypothetical protein n=1 Tax=Leucobacter massiliensis TaxID=1686285 RepID=UPI0015E41F7B|nr:hypothetical protein [Leucobacter massiliensis]